MDAKAFVTDGAALAAIGLAVLAANVGMMDHAAFWIVVALAVGWLVEPLVTRFDPFWPPSFYGENNDG